MEAPVPEAQYIVNKAIRLFGPASQQLGAFLSEVLRWNPSLGLVSKRDPIAACERLLLESLELGRELGLERERIADVGSGAGFPGLVWAIQFPQVDITMIERREKRALFLERTCRTLPVHNANTLSEDAHDAARRAELMNAFNLVATMAVGDPSALCKAIEPLLASGGRFASTIASAAEAPRRIGTGLELERRIDGNFGRHVIYRRGV
jgi:16S rRNA (guanine527-N7)-methyltransferase